MASANTDAVDNAPVRRLHSLFSNRDHMSSRTHVLLVFCLVASLALQAQVYPVQGNLVLNPPYSPYLSDLTAIGSQRLWLNLRLQDPTISTFPCKLRLTIEGVGITLRTKNAFLPPPITLEGGGIPHLFYGDDLAAYFNPANLDFAGLSRAQYERTQSLPEGVYRFSIEVLDYNRGTVVSNKISTTAWIVLNQPPLLNLPRHDNKITILEPSNIVFSWTPRHTGSPNSAFTTEYTFRLIELAPNASTQSANAAFLSQPVLYERTLTQNQLVYGPAEPALLAGRKYAWQIEASDTEGRDLFRNHGKSEVFVFQYGDAMGVPRNVVQQGGNSSTLSLQWELPTEGEMPIQYRIRYKPFTSTTDNYFESVTPNRFYTIGELIPATTYLVQVRAERNSIFSEYSTPLQMSTTSIEDRPYTCGQAPVLTPPGSTEILQHLFPGDEITMHDFRVRVLTVEGSNGNFNGTGLMPVSLFNNASVKVRYSGRVNKDYELAGEIVSLPRKNSAMGRLVDEMEKIGADRKTAQDKADSMANPTPVAIAITGIIDSVWVQDSVIVVQLEDGTLQEIARPQTQEGTMQQVVLTDSVGNSYTVTSEGNVMQTEVIQQNRTSRTDSLLMVQTELVKEVLEYFKTEVNLWLENNGKGPLEEELIKRIMAMPDCLPEDEEKLNVVLSKIQEHQEDPQVLLNLLKEDDTNKVRIEELTAKLSGKQPPYAAALSETEWAQLIDMMCPYFSKQEERPQLLSIEPIVDNQFAAGIDNDRLDIRYSIDTTKAYPLTFAKIEIYNNDEILVYLNSEDIDIGPEKTFAWDGKMNQGDFADKYIRYDQSPFTIKINASVNEDFTDSFEATTISRVHQYADEWNDASDKIKNRIYVNNAPPGTSKFSYYLLLRSQMIDKIEVENLDDTGPLGYMDTNDTTFTFLGKEISVHKNYQTILTEIENDIKHGGDYGNYFNKYPIGSYTIRFMNHSQVISDHSFGFALDIDPTKNPQITEMQNLFLKIATNEDFWYNNLSLDQMKNASNRYKQNINSGSMTEIINGFNFIKSYTTIELPKYFTQDILNDNIKTETTSIYNNYISLSQRSSQLVNDLWFEKRMSNDALTELQVLIPESCLSSISQVETIQGKIQRYKEFLNNGYKKAYSMTINFNEEYQYWNSYLTDINLILDKYKNAFRLIISEIEETKASNYLPALFDIHTDFPTMISFDVSKVNRFMTFTNRINEILSSSGMGYRTLSQYIDWLNQSDTKSLLISLGATGFFNLENKFVSYFINSNKIEWGGNWPKKRDWMHFQPTPAFLRFD